MRTVLSIILLVLTSAAVARADTLWTYSAPADPLTGSVTLDASRAPVAWTFTDGPVTLTPQNSVADILPHFGGGLLPGDQPFATWYLLIQGSGADVGAEFISYFSGSPSDNVDFATGPGAFYEQGHPGAWTDPLLATPEPPTWLLLVSGYLALAAIFLPLLGRLLRFGMTGKP